MSRSTSFDWYRLSKIDEEKLDIENFANLIKHSHFGEQLKRVPTSLRQKLLIVFQKASFDMKDNYEKENQLLNQLAFQKKIVAEQIKIMKHDLEYSIQKINGDKVLIDEKKKIIQKMKQKINKKQQKKLKQRANTERGAQIYFCPFCTREDFTSRDQFTFHMFREHSKSFNDIAHPTSNSNQGSITADVKDLILSLKDKQIQLMEMMLNKKKQMQTMELEYAYSQQIKKIRSQANFNDRKSEYMTNYDRKTKNQQEHQQQEQLKGESQYLFYQKSERTNPPAHRNQYDHPDSKIDKSFYEQSSDHNQSQEGSNKYQYQNRNQHQEPQPHQQAISNERQLRKHFVEPQKQNDYYNIFNSQVAVSQVDSLSSPQKINQMPCMKPTVFGDETLGPNPSPSMPIIGQSKFNQENPHTNKNLSWNQPARKPIQPIQPLQPLRNPVQSKIYNYTQNIQIGKPTQRSQIQISDRKYQTVYRQTKSNISQLDDGHIFNSGPLMDDDGDGSEYQDYFGQNREHQQSKDEVIDQQIKITKPKQNIVPHIKFNNNFQRNQAPQINSSSSSAKPHQNLSVSNSNNQSNVMLEYSKDKSFLDVSHSKQKSSDLIDLSNSFSKRGIESSNNHDQTINLSDLKLSKLEKERQQLKEQIRLAQHQMQLQRNIENHSIVEQTSSFSRQSKYKPNPSILEQFKRQQQIQVKYERIVSRTQKPVSTTKFKLPQNIELLQTKTGVLDEFFVKSLSDQRE